jgi:photosystem II stability/assembly factor-like uncharacterized protein
LDDTTGSARPRPLIVIGALGVVLAVVGGLAVASRNKQATHIRSTPGTTPSTLTSAKPPVTPITGPATVNQLDPSMPPLVTAGSDTWLIAAGGQLLSSPDKGATWKERLNVGSATGGPLGVTFANQTVGWLVSVSGLYGTGDAGTTWTAVHTPAPAVWAQRVDVANGWALSHTGQLFKTVDGGATWTVAPVPSPVHAACFRSAAEGYAGTGVPGATIQATTDGGLHWQAVLTRQAPAEKTDLDCAAPTVIARFTYGIGRQATGVFEVVTSTDGHTWNVFESNADPASGQTAPAKAAGAPDANTWQLPPVATPAGGLIGLGMKADHRSLEFLRSSDGGRSVAGKAAMTLPKQYDTFGFLSGSVFWDANSGVFAVTSNQDRSVTVFRTADGGQTWSVQATSF